MKREIWPFFVGPFVDAIWMGGASLILMAAFLLAGSGTYYYQMNSVCVGLFWIINYPHFAATSLQFYRNPRNRTSHPFVAFLLPLVLVAITGLVLIFSRELGPGYARLYSFWSPFHYSGQTFGLTLLYARRLKYSLSPWERCGLLGFVFGSYLYTAAWNEAIVGSPLSYIGLDYPSLGLPTWFCSMLGVGMTAGAAIFFGIFFYRYAREIQKSRWILLIPAVSQFVWLIPGSFRFAYLLFVPAFHSLQYLLISWAAAAAELQSPDEAAPGAPQRFGIATQTCAWFAQCVALGAGLFWALPRMVSTDFHIPMTLVEPVVLISVQFHHFTLDGILWKLKRPSASPLAVNLQTRPETQVNEGYAYADA